MFDVPPVPCLLSRETYSWPLAISSVRVAVEVSMAVALAAPSVARNTPWVASPFTPWPDRKNEEPSTVAAERGLLVLSTP